MAVWLTLPPPCAAEEIDPNYVPTQDEILEYAKWLGMDPDKDTDLMWIAREGLKAPLPQDWKPCKTKDTEEIYYFNFSTGESSWDHPCDEFYRKLYADHLAKAAAAPSNQDGKDPKEKERRKAKREARKREKEEAAAAAAAAADAAAPAPDVALGAPSSLSGAPSLLGGKKGAALKAAVAAAPAAEDALTEAGTGGDRGVRSGLGFGEKTR